MEFIILIGGIFLIYHFVKKKKDSRVNKRQNFSEKMNHSIDNNNDDLTTFVLSPSPYREEKSKNRNQGRWILPGESIKIAGREIQGGYFYYGGILKSTDGYQTEPSLVDDTLKLKTASNSRGENIGYWPSYQRLSPEERATYLDWLASDRSNPEIGISYVFIYFYGLERRILLDSQSEKITDDEFFSLFQEVKRLKTIYGKNRSFQNYSINLLGVMHCLRPELILTSYLDNAYESALVFKWSLSKYVASQQAIPADLALTWLVNYSDYRLRTPARRCPDQFEKLFKIEYENKFGEGLLIKPNKTYLKLNYQPASSALRGIQLTHDKLPDPSVLKAPINNELAPIADDCMEQLNAYSRYLGRNKGTSDNIAALLLLPKVLIDEDISLFSSFKMWANRQIKENKGIIEVAHFWEKLNLEVPERINKKEIEIIQNLTHLFGYGFAPDDRYHGARPKPEEKMVIYQADTKEEFIPSVIFHEVALSLRLGVLVALTDDHLASSELQFLTDLIDQNSQLLPVEKKSLHAYLTWRLHGPVNLIGLKAKIERLGEKEIETVRYSLINIALADGEIDPEEIKQIERLYRSLGLDSDWVVRDIHELRTASGRKIIGVAEKEVVGQESSIPIDHVSLAQYRADTHNVQNMLSQIFTDENETSSVDEEGENYDDLLSNIDGLDQIHYRLYRRLITQEEWNQEELNQLAEEFAIMINGALEVINDWAFDVVDAPIAEGNNPLYINLDIVEEIEEERKEL